MIQHRFDLALLTLLWGDLRRVRRARPYLLECILNFLKVLNVNQQIGFSPPHPPQAVFRRFFKGFARFPGHPIFWLRKAWGRALCSTQFALGMLLALAGPDHHLRIGRAFWPFVREHND
jgi:hypothetical protein